jgi:endonuclease YncB( thermonuclease family)
MKKTAMLILMILVFLSALAGCGTNDVANDSNVGAIKDMFDKARQEAEETERFIEDNKETIERVEQEVEGLIDKTKTILTDENKKKLLQILTSYTKEIKKIIADNAGAEDGDCETANIIRVIDGDTVVVELNGNEETVRLIGVNTPESVGQYKDNPQPYGVEASEFTKRELKKGATVYLTKDISETDKYQRLLRYVWLEKPNIKALKSTMFNAILLAEGYANTMTIPPDVKYAEVFKLLEREAMELKKGLWGL